MFPRNIMTLLRDLDARGGLSGPMSPESLMEYNHAIRVSAGLEMADAMDIAKSATAAGYGMQGVPFDSETITGADLAPLMIQSIQPTIDNLAYTRKDLTISQLFTSNNCYSTTHEWIQRESYGDEGLTIFAAEGSVAPISKSKFRRKTLNVYHLMEVREFTDVANSVSLTGGVGNARGLEMNDAALNFLRKKENAYCWADGRCNELGFTGLFPSIMMESPDSVMDLRNQMPTPQHINAWLAWLRSNPQFADIDRIKILTSIEGKQAFNDMAIPFARVDGLRSSKTMGYDFENSRFTQGVTLDEAQFLDHRQNPWGKKAGDSPPPEVDDLNPVWAAASAPTGSKWTAAETSSIYDYYYWVEVHGDGGFTTSGPLGPVRLAAGQAARLRIDLPSERDGDGGAKYMEIFRARRLANAAAPSSPQDFEWIMDVPFNKLNSGDTEVWDLNHQIPGTTNMLIGEFSPRVVTVTKLLDTYIRPLTRSMKTTTPFALVSHEGFKLKMPNKFIWLRNMPRQVA